MRLRTIAALLIAALSGAMWFAALDAILLFRAMDDPAGAGLLAANGFAATYWVGAVACLVGLLVSKRSRVIAGVLLLVAALMLFWIVPTLRAHGAGWPGSFASLHASASLGHLLLCLGTAYWSWRLASAKAMPPRL
jgi:hypothetical protein